MIDTVLVIVALLASLSLVVFSLAGAVWSAIELRRRWTLRNELPSYASRKDSGGGYIVKSNGAAFGTQIIDSRTGEPLPYVTKLQWYIDPDDRFIPKVQVELMCVSLHLELERDSVDVTCQSRKNSILGQEASDDD